MTVLRTARFWIITQRVMAMVMVITTTRCFAAEAWNHAMRVLPQVEDMGISHFSYISLGLRWKQTRFQRVVSYYTWYEAFVYYLRIGYNTLISIMKLLNIKQ
jgi:hypothetical protein